MPTADGKPIAEDIVAFLQSKPSVIALSQHVDLFAGGFADLVNRVRNLEHASLANAHAAEAVTAQNVAYETRIAALEGNDKEYKTRIAKVEEAPTADGKRLDDLEKRVRTVEGAVGSAGYKAAKDAPAPTTFKGPDATAPVAETKPAATGTIFGGPAT